jgi:hypothetical protein
MQQDAVISYAFGRLLFKMVVRMIKPISLDSSIDPVPL